MSGWTFHQLATTSMATLEKVFRAGDAPPLEELVGWEYRGWNVLPSYGVPVFWAMSNLRFIKVFYQTSLGQGPSEPASADGAQVRGTNMKVTRGGRYTPWVCTPSDSEPTRRGWYNVYPPGVSPRGAEYPHALFLDYALPRNTLLTGKNLEDYVVMPNPGRPELLLGKAYLVLGPTRFGGFFVAERLQRQRLASDKL